MGLAPEAGWSITPSQEKVLRAVLSRKAILVPNIFELHGFLPMTPEMFPTSRSACGMKFVTNMDEFYVEDEFQARRASGISRQVPGTVVGTLHGNSVFWKATAILARPSLASMVEESPPLRALSGWSQHLLFRIGPMRTALPVTR